MNGRSSLGDQREGPSEQQGRSCRNLARHGLVTEGSRTVGKTLSERVEMGMAGGIVDETEGWLP